MKGIINIGVLSILLALPSSASASVREICPGYQYDSPKPIKFNENEKKLICGDPDAGSWEDIPAFEAKYFIKTFLQDQGYFFPTFTDVDGIVTIDPGEQAKIRQIEVKGSPPDFFDVTRRRKIKNQVMTPAILNTLENWTASVLKNNGYACPIVRTTAYPETGVVVLDVDPGPYQNIAEVIEEPVEGLREGTLERYRAFNIGDPYNAQNLSVTSSRIELTDGILQSSYFLTECTPGGAVLTQKSIAGPKRLVGIGVGASTEDFIIAKLRLKWTRIGLNGSSIALSARGSYRKQWLNAQGFVYFLPKPSHWYLNPFATTQRRDEKQFEYTAFDVGLPGAYTWDTRDVGFRLRFGPRFNFTRTDRGADPGDTHFVMGSAQLEMASHDYQFFLADPKQGFYMNARADFNHDALGSSVTAQQLKVSGIALWNIGNFEPPLLVIAMRGLAGTTLTDTGGSNFSRLPPHFFYYLGGSATLRGFSRRELPNANRGALTALYSGAEVRLTNVLPLNIQPLAFFDIAALGQKSLSLDFPIYWSPGIGARWPSLVGVFRFTVGHGFLINNKNPANDGLKHWQFYFSYGEEF